jgi:hypothetical protein
MSKLNNNQIVLEEDRGIHAEIVELLHVARSASVRSVNALMMTAAYWEIGRRIVEFEQ